jgi:tetratricopeptide (TPR) repeat protein
LIEEIDAAIKKATLDGSLTPAQILVARINAIPDDAPAAATQAQSALLTELISTQPRSFIDYLGYDVFFKHKRNRAAVVCFKSTLEARPGDANARLNMGIAFEHLQMFAEAEGAADYVLKEDTGLTEHGYVVAFQVKAVAALGQREFAKAMDYADQAFRLNPSSTYLMSLWQLAAAQNGDLDKFYEVVAANEKALPQDYARLRSRTNAVEAFLLFRKNEIEKAQALVRKSLGTDRGDSDATYWGQYPTGEDIVKVWKQLQTISP